jgi:hypothetical protein
MSIHYDKLSFTKEQVEKDNSELDGHIIEDDTFYIIEFPFNEGSKCDCKHFSDCTKINHCKVINKI